MEGLRFEKRGEGDYYKTILHIGDCFIPISDDTVEDLKAQLNLSTSRFLDIFLEKVGYSSYLKDQIRAELSKLGDPAAQKSVLQQSLQDL